MFKKYEAGVSFSDNTGQIVVLRTDRKPWRLCHLAEFRTKAVSPIWFLQPLLERDVKIYRKVKKVSIAIDYEKLFHCTVPVDSTLDSIARKEQIEWELSQFIPQESVREYVSDTHVLAKQSVEGTEDTLIVAATREFIKQLEGELHKYKFKTGIIDSSFFAAQTAAVLSHSEVQSQQLAIVGVFPRRVDVGILFGGTLYDYRAIGITSPREVPPVVDSALEQTPIESLCLYGMNIGSQLVDKLRETPGRKVFFLDPFKTLESDIDEQLMQQFRGREHVFAPAVGIVMMRP